MPELLLPDLMRKIDGRFVILSLVIATVLVTGAVTPQNASAQSVTIKTSADSHDGSFFGEGVLQVVITDPDSSDDGAIEDFTVELQADPDSGSQGSLSLTVPETSESSGRFEFFLAHEDASAVDPADLDPINSAGVEGDGSCVSDCAPFVTFGPSGDLQVDAGLYESVKFTINTGDQEVTVNYDDTLGKISLDRASYGTNSFVYVFIDDQDANLNPFATDEFVVDPGSAPNSDLLFLGGGDITAPVTFRETGDNTARFEGKYQLGSSIAVQTKALALTLNDKADYGSTLSADENDSHATDEVSFVIGNTPGTIGVGITTYDAKISSPRQAYGLGDNVTVSVTDLDANANPAIADTIPVRLATSGGNATINARETGASTGVFTVTFALSQGGRINGTQLQVAVGEAMTVSYVDQKPADYQSKVDKGLNPARESSIEINVLAGREGPAKFSVSAPMASPIGGPAGPVQAGSQLALSTTVRNDKNATQPFVTFIEVRDEQGITVYLAWQSGSLGPGQSSDVGVSWTPDMAGRYEVRTFAVSSLSDTAVLTPVATGTVQVS